MTDSGSQSHISESHGAFSLVPLRRMPNRLLNRNAFLFRTSLAAGLLALILAGCDSSPSAPQIASIRVEASASSVIVGQTLQLTATPLDPSGQPVSGVTVEWSSSNANILEVSASGLATAKFVGVASARASVGTVVGSRVIDVLPVPVAQIRTTPSTVEVMRNRQVELAVTLLDAQGNPLTERSVTFSALDGEIASVSGTGVVTGRREGSTSIRVRSESVEHLVPVQVLPGGEPIVGSVSASTVSEGMTFDIVGQRFSSLRLSNDVTLGGAPLEILEAEETRLRVRVPAVHCIPAGPAQLVVKVGPDPSDPFTLSFSASNTVSVGLGQLQILPTQAAGCVRVAPSAGSAAYLIGIQSVTGDANTIIPITVQGRASAGPAPAMLQEDAVGMSFQALVADRLQRSPERDAVLRAHEQEKLRLREAEAWINQGLEGAPRVAAATSTGAASSANTDGPARVPANVRVGDTVSVNMPDIRPGVNFCQTGIPIRARVAHVGERSIWLFDVNNPPVDLQDAAMAALGSQFDQRILPALGESFGEPTDLDGNNRIVILATEQLNRIGNTLGFVVSSDFRPKSTCPASNFGEYYYTIAPDPNRTIEAPSGRQSIYWSVNQFIAETPRLAAHEITHVIQFGRRTAEGVGFGQVWESEGQAVLAEEVAGFRELGLSARQNLGFTVAWNPDNLENRTPTTWFRSRFIDLAVYYGFSTPEIRTLGAPGACTWLRTTNTGPCDYGRLAYGVSWSFLRWVTDHRGGQFSGGANDLQRRLTTAPVSGFGAIEWALSEPVAPLLAYWAASLYTDGRLVGIPGADPQLSFPSWDLRNIDTGLVVTARLEPARYGFGSFQFSQDLAAASTVYLHLSGTAGPGHATQIQGAAGTQLPTTAQVWIVRLQ